MRNSQPTGRCLLAMPWMCSGKASAKEEKGGMIVYFFARTSDGRRKKKKTGTARAPSRQRRARTKNIRAIKTPPALR